MATPTSFVTKGPKALPVLASTDNLARLQARSFDMNYATLTFPSGGANKYAMPGLIIAVDAATEKYVPYRDDATYGIGSDTAVGVLIEILELTTWDRECTPAYHAELVEAYCLEIENGSTLGSISAAVKTDLPSVFWK